MASLRVLMNEPFFLLKEEEASEDSNEEEEEDVGKDEDKAATVVVGLVELSLGADNVKIGTVEGCDEELEADDEEGGTDESLVDAVEDDDDDDVEENRTVVLRLSFALVEFFRRIDVGATVEEELEVNDDDDDGGDDDESAPPSSMLGLVFADETDNSRGDDVGVVEGVVINREGE